ncbi:MAG: DNA mismatch repair protein MutS [Ruminococcaceae bacterium]|nr:DNA mismatch repair protein MutS [Oscillospiraceae bacterium]
MGELTPMMRQYLEIKEKSKDAILFFRLGDFYEMFFEDAEVAARELELVLTGRDCGLEKRAPMCGIPYHASLSYISRLISKGYKVAICEQMEDPSTATGIVKRDIIKIYTPGTVTDEQMLNKNMNNFIMSIYSTRGLYGVAAADLSTGEMHCTSLTIGNTLNHLLDETAKFSPSEIIINADAENREMLSKRISAITGAYVGFFGEEGFEFNKASALVASHTEKNRKMSEYDISINAAGALLSYMTETQKTNLDHILKIDFYKAEEFMAIDAASRRNLEITETLREKARKGSLLWVLDRTQTSMGGRLLRKWIEQPLIDADAIKARHESVGELKDKFMVRSELRELLSGVYDIERLTAKAVLGSMNARDMISLRQSLNQIPYIKEILSGCLSPLSTDIYNGLDELTEICQLITDAIKDDPPVQITGGDIIKEGFNEDVDRCRYAAKNGKDWLADLELREKEETGIPKLKIGYNKVFGYYLEVTKSYIGQVPDRYIRKQTLTNCERYITEELKSMEDEILGSEEQLVKLEYELFVKIRETVAGEVARLKATALKLSEIDVLASFAEVADRENYCCPEIHVGTDLVIKDGRHPVVEKTVPAGEYVANDILLDTEENNLLVITGPNMAGKSTYMRQTALTVLMAQAGSFVPASYAKIGVVDKLFTRVGASDDLASGQSTFMVEMSEVANILLNATERSLLILDEIGRGTSTFDGLSIAWSVLEYVVKQLGSRTMFATHYHELTELEGKIPGLKNYCVSINKNGDEIVFLRKVKRGGADGSYGISVAALAGIPNAVTIRAKEILATLEEQDISRKELKVAKLRSNKKSGGEGQLDLFQYAVTQASQDEILEELKRIDVQAMTPIEAMNVLYSLKQKAMQRK